MRSDSEVDHEDHEADEHGEAAERRDGEGLQRRAAALLAARVVPDQEVGEHARRLPEDEQQEHVVGGDEPEHHAGEGEQQCGEPAEGGFVVGEIVRAVHKHERADARDDEGEEQGERVDAERQRDPELRDPGHRLDDGPAVEDAGQPGEQHDEYDCRHERDEGEDATAQQPRGERRQERDSAEGDEAGDHPPSSRRAHIRSMSLPDRPTSLGRFIRAS